MHTHTTSGIYILIISTRSGGKKNLKFFFVKSISYHNKVGHCPYKLLYVSGLRE